MKNADSISYIPSQLLIAKFLKSFINLQRVPIKRKSNWTIILELGTDWGNGTLWLSINNSNLCVWVVSKNDKTSRNWIVRGLDGIGEKLHIRYFQLSRELSGRNVICGGVDATLFLFLRLWHGTKGWMEILTFWGGLTCLIKHMLHCAGSNPVVCS